jgi:hypothetical protein
MHLFKNVGIPEYKLGVNVQFLGKHGRKRNRVIFFYKDLHSEHHSYTFFVIKI